MTLQVAQPALVVTDENEIPETYWVVPPARLDRMNLKVVLKAGEAVPGAALGNPRSTIVLRTS